MACPVGATGLLGLWDGAPAGDPDEPAIQIPRCKLTERFEHGHDGAKAVVGISES